VSLGIGVSVAGIVVPVCEREVLLAEHETIITAARNEK
jgi:hypothetical protein